MVLEARRLVDSAKEGDDTMDEEQKMDKAKIASLQSFGYNEAAELVYGTSDIGAWKARHQKPASPEQLNRYTASSALHAVHDDTARLAVVGVGVSSSQNASATATATTTATTAPSVTDATKASLATTPHTTKTSLISNVCCQDVENDDINNNSNKNNDDDDDDDDVATVTSKTKNLFAARPESEAEPTGTTIVAPPLLHLIDQYTNNSISKNASSSSASQFPVTAVMTVSDRAYAGQYETGDLSGPAVMAAIQSLTGLLDLEFVTVVVPDDNAAIQAKLKILSNQGVDLILTTGGTGFSPRDVTPEATADAVDYELTSLMAWVATSVGMLQQQQQQQQLQQQRESDAATTAAGTPPNVPPPPIPIVTLSRGTAGILNTTVIANLPGNPQAAAEIMPILLPLLLHAVSDLHLVTPEILHIG